MVFIAMQPKPMTALIDSLGYIRPTVDATAQPEKTRANSTRDLKRLIVEESTDRGVCHQKSGQLRDNFLLPTTDNWETWAEELNR